jgi:hypothetical protein
MNKNYLVKLKIEHAGEKPLTEQYLVNATGTVDAQEKITASFTDVQFDFEVVSVSETKILEYIQ